MATIKIQKKNDRSQLGTAVNLQQYITSDNKKIITIIAEYHDYNFNCINNKDISQYCFEEVNGNKNCRILLEYSKYDNPKTIGSKSINDTYNKLVKNNKQNHIIPIDYRTLFLKSEGQSNIYDIDWNKTKYKKEKIIKKFIQPFYKLAKKIFIIDSDHYKYDSYLNINKYIKNDIEPQFDFIVRNIDHFDIGKLQEELKITWNKVMDIGIIITILKNGKIDEFILIAGVRHCKNLQKMMNTYFRNDFRFMHQQHGDKGKCIQLDQTNDKVNL
jgi:hypothetical protein